MPAAVSFGQVLREYEGSLNLSLFPKEWYGLHRRPLRSFSFLHEVFGTSGSFNTIKE